MERASLVFIFSFVVIDLDDVRQVVQNIIPLDRLVLETDAPYITPHPFSGLLLLLLLLFVCLFVWLVGWLVGCLVGWLIG
jgi:hypothetical protein